MLLLLGDQVYADQTSEATAQALAARRDLTEPPWKQVADYEEYTYLYYESWLDPEVRWLLSTVPSCMIFDDHDVIDDWNTSASWLARMRATPWWRERILGGLMSYWVHQHLGNLSPAELAADELYAQVRAVPDATELVREFAAGADNDPAHARWSYRRDFGRVRLVMIDTRATRVLDEATARCSTRPRANGCGRRCWTGAAATTICCSAVRCPGCCRISSTPGRAGTPRCAPVNAAPLGRRSELLRQRADLEHWAAFPGSFTALTELIGEAASGPDAPATVCVLSGDVHHAYVAEPHWRGAGPHPTSRVLQLTCSPSTTASPARSRPVSASAGAGPAAGWASCWPGTGGCPARR